MSIKGLQEFDASILFTDFGEPVTYQGVGIDAVIEFGEDRAAGNTFVSDGQAARVTLWVRDSDVTSPQEQDRVVFAGETWRVARILERLPGMFCLELTGRQTAW